MVSTESFSGREQSFSAVPMNGPTIQQWNKNNTLRFKGKCPNRASPYQTKERKYSYYDASYRIYIETSLDV